MISKRRLGRQWTINQWCTQQYSANLQEGLQRSLSELVCAKIIKVAKLFIRRRPPSTAHAEAGAPARPATTRSHTPALIRLMHVCPPVCPSGDKSYRRVESSPPRSRLSIPLYIYTQDDRLLLGREPVCRRPLLLSRGLFYYSITVVAKFVEHYGENVFAKKPSLSSFDKLSLKWNTRWIFTSFRRCLKPTEHLTSY